MSNRILEKNIFYNSVSEQHLSFANQLTVHSWNDIINMLKFQANANAYYLEHLHKWLVGDDSAVTPEDFPNLLEYVKYVNDRFTDYYTKVQVDQALSNYYTKDIVDEKIQRLSVDLNNIHGQLITRLSTKAEISWVDQQLSTKANKTDLFSKDYNDLLNTPTIPERVSQLQNDSNFTNKTYVDNLVASVPKFAILVVEQLPTANISNTTVYLVPSDKESLNLYDEYIYVNGVWELLGTAKINLDNYATFDDLPTKLSELVNDTNFTNRSYVDEHLSTKANKSELFNKDYNELVNKPTIPTKTSELENDSNFLTEHQSLDNYVTKDEAFSGSYNDLTDKPEVYTKTEINNKLTRDNVISIIGKASQTLDGIMSKEDKKNLDTIVSLLEEDDNNIVDKINEVLAIFNQYPEGAELVTVLSQKQDKLVSGITIKTINNQSLLGEGNIEIEAGETLIENESLTTVAVGGISKGVSLNGKSVVEVLENIFFPYVAFAMGGISSSPENGTVVEKGTAKTVNSITQAITLGSKKLTSLKLYKGSTLLQEKTSGITTSNTFSNLAQSLTATTTFKVEATDGTTNLSKSINVFTFVDPYFYGILDTNTTPTSGDITNKTKAVASKGNKTYSFTCTAKFPFIAYPASYGNLKSILDGNGFENLTDFTKHTVTLSITSGNVSYNVYIKNSAATVTNFAYTFKYWED